MVPKRFISNKAWQLPLNCSLPAPCTRPSPGPWEPRRTARSTRAAPVRWSSRAGRARSGRSTSASAPAASSCWSQTPAIRHSCVCFLGRGSSQLVTVARWRVSSDRDRNEQRRVTWHNHKLWSNDDDLSLVPQPLGYSAPINLFWGNDVMWWWMCDCANSHTMKRIIPVWRLDRRWTERARRHHRSKEVCTCARADAPHIWLV